ncbi:MAG: bifunctional folylpolyglutamate synthase/dihydrofolate synthase, partial [Bacteroidales bacterium]|nr:bifunctional folylpolyglutamate synthase/dihydrofolate synthase [Bacteroidales bacterium]
MAAYDADLGYPSRAFRSVHVAGTNGKGTVCSLLAASLAARGYTVGLYTSPHLLDFRERIKCVDFSGGGSFRMIPEQDVSEFLSRHDRDGLSFFELTTGMAFWWFARQRVDVAVVETGLGGRLDSTNILRPELGVLTGIGLDHCAWLGNTRAAIAAEKAGIFKPGVPALVWGRDAETAPVFARVAAAVGCPLHFADDNPGWPLPEEGLETPTRYAQNLRTAQAALALLSACLPPLPTPQPLSETDALRRAASLTGLRGRWEWQR